MAQSSKTVERGNENGGSGNGREHGTNDEFRRIQEESRRMSDEDTELFHSGNKKIDENLRSVLSRVLGRRVESVCGRRGNGNGRITVNDGKGTSYNLYQDVDGTLFHDVFEISKNYLRNGELVDLHGVETTQDGIGYNDCYNYISDDGLSGFSITPKGDLISVFNASGKPGFLWSIVPIVNEKAKTLDCYASAKQNLPVIYSKIFGWQTASVMDYNMEYDHDNIAENHGKPQVAFMVNTDREVSTKHFNKDRYDEAVQYRNSFISDALRNNERRNNNERGELRISGERRGQTVQDSGRKGRSMEEGTGRTARRLMDIAGESLAAELRGSEYFDGFERQAEAVNKPRFSMETVDSDGNRLSEQQIEFFKDSKIRDEEGNLLRVYHGTDTSFTVFDKTKGRSNMDIQGMFFSPWELDAQGYGESVRAYYINIVNPAPEQTAYRALNKFKGQNNAGVKAREYLESLGYDGVNNSDEEYIAFNSNQIKLAENSEPTSDDDIRFSSENDEKLYRQLQDWLKGKGKAHGTYNGKEFDLGMTPKNLIDNGAKKSRLYTFENVIVKITGGKHSIALEEIAKLPSQLADPILLFDGNDKNTLVALTEIKDKEENDVIVTLRIKTSYGRNKATVVTSAYAKSDEYGNNKIVNYVLNQIKAGKLRDVSINKTSNWFTTVGRQLPSVVQTMLDDKRRLARQGKTVNTFNTNVTNNSDISSTKDSNDTRTSRETYTNISLERFKELEKNNKALEKRVKQLRKRTEHFKAELRQTPKAIKQNPLLDMSVCRKIADRLESGLGLMFDEKGSITYSELVQLIYDMGQANFQTDGWNEETTQKANETIDVLAKKAMEAAMEDTNEYLNEGLDKVKSYLKRIKIYVSPKLRAGVADFGKDYVKKYAGRIIFTYTYEKAYVNVEDVYSELNGMAPGLFPDGIINPS